MASFGKALTTRFRGALRALALSRAREERLFALWESSDTFDLVMDHSGVDEYEEDKRQERLNIASAEIRLNRGRRQFVSKYGFLLRESKFRLSDSICNCGIESEGGDQIEHYMVIIGSNGRSEEMCPYRLTLVLSKLNMQSGVSAPIELSEDRVRVILDKAKVKK